MPHNVLYTDLSGYYDLMCADIDYQAQSNTTYRLNQIFGNNGVRLLDLACGTGPHIRHFVQQGYQCHGLDINQPMLDIAQQRCPEAQFRQGNMCTFETDNQYDLITCFLYSIHYSGSIENLKSCIESAYKALSVGGIFCFNSVDKDHINNTLSEKHRTTYEGSEFFFDSSWHYSGEGEKQTLKLSVEKTTAGKVQHWTDKHPMVALNFATLQNLLTPYFDIHIFEHDYNKLISWGTESGNAIFVCVKK
jgi:ubiquinone/menaquinone biosynthesis C-methylase UbiE